MKMPRTFVEDFNTVIEHCVKTYPEWWPEAEREALIEEAKGAARRDPETAIEFYTKGAASVRAGGTL